MPLSAGDPPNDAVGQIMDSPEDVSRPRVATGDVVVLTPGVERIRATEPRCGGDAAHSAQHDVPGRTVCRGPLSDVGDRAFRVPRVAGPIVWA